MTYGLVVGCYVVICILIFISVFFFKQKTAYEMRISDWSSDVCSSDLLRALDVPVGAYIPDRLMEGYGPSGAALVRIGEAGSKQIGRASCRERVCQHV